MNVKKYWIALLLVFIFSFSVLSYFGHEIYNEAPPIPSLVLSDKGEKLFTRDDILDGQNVWQSIGGHETGSIWGHGAYVAPDWSADWIHRESEIMLDLWAKEMRPNQKYSDLNNEEQAALKERLQTHIRNNSYNKETEQITLSDQRIQVIKMLMAHYAAIFMGNGDSSQETLRKQYAIRKGAISDEERMRKLSAFLFWTAWACETNRENSKVSYTNNWPPEKLIGNVPSPSLVIWTGFSVIMLLVGIGILAFYYSTRKVEEEYLPSSMMPKTDPLANIPIFPSMMATLKYFWIVTLLILAQLALGVLVAHYGVEGEGFYGIPLADLFPYSITRTWHIQLAIFWIATSWLATGLFIAPALSGKEAPLQKWGVNILFIALLIIVLGSMFGEWLGIMQKLGLRTNFWFGHQGQEYVELGRFWQIFLFAGLLIWLFLLLRALLPALKNPGENKQLLSMFVIASTAIALFYGAGLMWGQRTNLAVTEYWRWWVVHLWVEGFFEVFATVVIAFIFVKLGLLRSSVASVSVLFSTIIYLSGGILGTFHHLYFTGTPTAVMALGATFSALEVVPLVLMGYEAYKNYKLGHATDWLITYKWPIYFFVAVSFWNLVGAGIFGFLINPPIALYYMQGLNTTPLHGHAALFGVYGMLGMGLMLFVIRVMTGKNPWTDTKNEKILKYSFWAINLGLMLMLLLSLLPVGLIQTLASVEVGMWYARSPELLNSSLVMNFKWMRAIGDTLFGLGSLGLAYFIFKVTLPLCSSCCSSKKD